MTTDDIMEDPAYIARSESMLYGRLIDPSYVGDFVDCNQRQIEDLCGTIKRLDYHALGVAIYWILRMNLEPTYKDVMDSFSNEECDAMTSPKQWEEEK